MWNFLVARLYVPTGAESKQCWFCFKFTQQSYLDNLWRMSGLFWRRGRLVPFFCGHRLLLFYNKSLVPGTSSRQASLGLAIELGISVLGRTCNKCQICSASQEIKADCKLIMILHYQLHICISASNTCTMDTIYYWLVSPHQCWSVHAWVYLWPHTYLVMWS